MSVSNREQPGFGRHADVAVVGSGPCGLMTALALADAGMDVLLVESGGADDGAQALSDAHIADPARHAAMALAVKRAPGGTSALWGGRAVAFDEIDFEARAHVAGARWPIAAADVAPWYAPACEFLDCGPATFEEAWPEPISGLDGLTLDRLERWCAHPDMWRRHGERVGRHPRLRLALGTTVTAIGIDPASGRVGHLAAVRGGAPIDVRARAYVIAAGGVETTRLMLASRANAPSLFGGPHGALGRHYMGHLFGSIADIQFLSRGDDARFDFHKDESSRYVRRRITLDAATQSALGLMNMAAWPDLPELYNSAHRSGVLSLAYLALATPVIGPKLMTEAIRRRKLGEGPLRIGPHLWNVVRGAPSAAVFAARFMAARYASSVRLPGFFVRNAAMRYAFHYHAEHMPDAESRITLSEARDALGMQRARIDLRFGEADAASILKTHDAMGERLAAGGIARIEHRLPESDRAAAILAQASDGFHQIGTARMSAVARDGVVDRNARVHGVANLFLAGSAILPSSGQANPTLLAVALAARLAGYLKGELAALPG